MLKNIALFLLSSRFSIAVSQNLNGMAGFFQRHFSGTDNLRVVSVILLLLAFVLFLFLIVILYIKSLLAFIKNDVAADGASAGGAYAQAAAPIANNERELERGLNRELEKSEQQRLALQQQKRNQNELERRRRENAEKELSEQRKRDAEKKMQKNMEYAAQNYSSPFSSSPLNGKSSSFAPQSTGASAYAGRGNASSKEFDWRKGRAGELDEMAAGIKPFKYTPAKKSLADLTGLLINMMGRDIDEGKIAQILKAKCGDLATEEDVIQLVDAVKNFIHLAINGKFDRLPEAADLPTPDEALYALSQGNPSQCLDLLQALMDNTSERCCQFKGNQSKRDLAFLEASNYTCTFGTLASIQDIKLSTGAFELAIELSPKNVNAWGRVGDMYAKANSESKAIWAYQQVLNMADEEMYSHQVANANKHLSQFYYDQGDNRKAANLYNSSNDYYNQMGINEDLTSREQDIIEIIEANQEKDLPATINKLLSVKLNIYRSQGM
jgi:F0F1-type ATP synthase membrane subunit b/b'